MPRPKSLSRIYKGLRPHIEEVTKATMINPDFYEISLRAALAKSFDFNEHVAKKSTIGHSFYLTATLRGVCEDLIALTSFHHLPKDERSKLIQNIQLLSCFEGMKTQEDFFQKNRPWQTVPCYKDIDDLVQDKKTELVDLYKELKLVVGKQKSPRVKDLAERAGLLALYEFIYSATSRWVHFNPHVLLRMGWTKDVDFLSGIYTFSPSHFSVYYFAFNQYYGAYLFKLFYDTFASEL
ncbi:MAG: hypothetical protein IPM25_20115, partial [Chloracidobacterium sp.]|nr:hypothetical protein [Chloracidobacterium sp.]